jgi:DNA-binding transcriptional ArsR family regulator
VSEPDDLQRFVGSTFRSVWSLELLLLLKRERRPLTRQQLVSVLRASDLVVSRALDELIAAGLVLLEDEGASYLPVNDETAASVEEVEKLYRARPDAVRRVIVSASASRASAFADAFKLRKD